MDIGQILGRAWKITWKWKELWLFGLLVNIGYGLAAVQLVIWMPALENLMRLEEAEFPSVFAAFFARAAIGTVAASLLYLAWAVFWLIGHGALIAAVRQAEEEGTVNMGQAWKSGAQHFWTLLGVAVLRLLPYLAMTVLSMVLILAMAPFAEMRDGAPAAAGLLCGVPLILLVGGIAFLMTYLISLYANRAAVLNGRSWLDAFREGWAVLKKAAGNTLLLGLIFAAIWYAANMVIQVPVWASFMSVFSQWSSQIEYAHPPFMPSIPNLAPLLWGGVAMTLLGLAIGTVFQTWVSAAWTLAYRGTAVAKENLGETTNPVN